MVSQTIEHRCYTVGQMADDSFAIYYQSPPTQNADGSTTLHMRFPALIATDWFDDVESSLKHVCTALNNYIPIVEALKEAADDVEDLRKYANNHGGMIDNERCDYARDALAKAVSA